MKIAVVQIIPFKGNIEQNILRHVEMIQQAIWNQVDAIFFSELSLTNYEPNLAKALRINIDDERLSTFQKLSKEGNIIIAIGAPTKHQEDTQISMLIFHPNKPLQKYSKQLLHEDELPYFVNGKEQLLITQDEVKIAPAICYESMQPTHIEKAISMNANVYIASVAKHQKGIEAANQYFPQIAKQYGIPILMANALGPCDNFVSAGQSAIWNSIGQKIGNLEKEEGLLIYDTRTEEIIKLVMPKIKA